jgi:hypothetical protein
MVQHVFISSSAFITNKYSIKTFYILLHYSSAKPPNVECGHFLRIHMPSTRILYRMTTNTVGKSVSVVIPTHRIRVLRDFSPRMGPNNVVTAASSMCFSAVPWEGAIRDATAAGPLFGGLLARTW